MICFEFVYSKWPEITPVTHQWSVKLHNWESPTCHLASDLVNWSAYSIGFRAISLASKKMSPFSSTPHSFMFMILSHLSILLLSLSLLVELRSHGVLLAVRRNWMTLLIFCMNKKCAELFLSASFHVCRFVHFSVFSCSSVRLLTCL